MRARWLVEYATIRYNKTAYWKRKNTYEICSYLEQDGWTPTSLNYCFRLFQSVLFQCFISECATGFRQPQKNMYHRSDNVYRRWRLARSTDRHPRQSNFIPIRKTVNAQTNTRVFKATNRKSDPSEFPNAD